MDWGYWSVWGKAMLLAAFVVYAGVFVAMVITGRLDDDD